MKRNLKLWVAVAIAILSVIVVLQNRETVTTKILFIDIDMPHAVLLFTTLVAGFVIGVLVRFRVGARKR